MALPKLCVVGAGKLGACMTAVFSASGYSVIAADIDAEAIDAINRGDPPPKVNEPGLAELIDAHRPLATTDVRQAASDSDIVFVVVPTPSGADDRFDSSMVVDAVHEVGRGFMRKRDRLTAYTPTIVITSTVQPGTCNGPVTEELESIGFSVNRVDASGKRPTVTLAHSPEFIALGSVVHDLLNPDVCYIGCDRAATDLESVYARVCPNAPRIRLSLIDSEIAKLSLNVALSVKIGLANTIARVSETFPGADAYKVCEAVGWDSRIGHGFFKPGSIPGGPCLPRDLRAFATLHDSPGSLVRGAQEAAQDVVEWVQREVAAADTELRQKGEREPVRVGLLGLAYKPETSIADESLGWRVAELLVANGYLVYTDDPFVTDAPRGSCQLGFLETLELPVVVVACAHDLYRGLPALNGQTLIDIWQVCRDDGAGTVVRPGVGPGISR